MIVRFGRAPALHLFGNGARGFEHAHGAAHVVGRARAPTVAMAADDHELVGEFAAANDAERVVDRLERLRRAIVLHRDARTHRPGADVIAEGKTALPPARNSARRERT